MRHIRSLMLLMLGTATAASSADTVADSVSDLGSVQGGGNWHYGYIDPAQGAGFIAFPNFGLHAGSPAPEQQLAWFIEYLGDPIIHPTPYTHVTATGGHPNTGVPGVGPVHHTVKRWISEVGGAITITGIFGDYTPDFGAPGVMDGVTGRILVDGVQVWSTTTTGLTADGPFQATATIAVGSVVDFVLEPNANADNDTYTWTIEIEGCRADWNGDAAVTSSDISAFLTAWLTSVTTGTLTADFSGNGMVDSTDISAFLVAWLDAVQGGC